MPRYSKCRIIRSNGKGPLRKIRVCAAIEARKFSPKGSHGNLTLVWQRPGSGSPVEDAFYGPCVFHASTQYQIFLKVSDRKNEELKTYFIFIMVILVV